MSTIDRLLTTHRKLADDLRVLSEQAIEAEAAAVRMAWDTTSLLEAAMREGALTLAEQTRLGHDTLPGQPTNDEDEWRYTAGLSTWRDIGEWLVNNADWERHPSGVGKRQFYRAPAEDTGE